jgi:hypothetical protein
LLFTISDPSLSKIARKGDDLEGSPRLAYRRAHYSNHREFPTKIVRQRGHSGWRANTPQHQIPPAWEIAQARDSPAATSVNGPAGGLLSP